VWLLAAWVLLSDHREWSTLMSTCTSDDFGPSPLDVVDTTFEALVCEPRPLALDGARLGHGLPPRLIPLGELRVMLLHPSMTYTARDAVWRELVHRARSSDPAWIVGAAGVALPALRQLAGQLAADYDGDTHDLDAEMLAGLVQAIREIDVSGQRIASRLCFAAFNAGRRLRRREAAHTGRRAELTESGRPPRPWGHPDFVLARAVAAGVLTRTEAGLIGRTRLEDTPLAPVAAEYGLSYTAARSRRRRAEFRLARAIHDEELEES
jgi:hypothetical protein